MAKLEAHNPLEGDRPDLSFDLHDGTDEQVSIIVVHKDKPAHLNICLQSIAVTSFNNNYELIVVDNASEAESQDFLDDVEGEVKVIRNEKNLYWSEAANKGAEAADKKSKYLVFMHCDVVILNPSWLDLLVNVSESQKSGLVGVEMQSYFLQQKKVDFIRDWLIMFTRECWNDVGPWPNKLPLIGSSFLTTIKAQHHGYKPQVMKNQIAHHYKIFSIDINEYERFTEQAMVTIPQMLRDFQSESVKPVI
ncbi:MAG: glycosyltransferase [Crenarchaeota archaeon]|nr:MAG: glycosyltransferase [Thermoproteota archaeon]